MICWAVPSSLGPRDMESVWADPVGSVWDEGASGPVVGSDRGMTSMASAAETEGEKLFFVSCLIFKQRQIIVFPLIYDEAHASLLAVPTCSTCIKLRVCVCLVHWMSVILSNRKQVGVHLPCAGHSSGVAAVPFIPLSHQSHHQILQLCQLCLMETQQQGRIQNKC